MHERRADEPIAAHLHDAVGPAPAAARLPLQVPQRLRQRRVVAGAQLGHDAGRRDRPQHADRLRRPEGQVEPGDTVHAWLADAGAGEQVDEVVAVDLAAPLQQPCPDADPAAGLLTLTGVVVLAAPCDLIEVVRRRGRPGQDLPDAQHRRHRSSLTS